MRFLYNLAAILIVTIIIPIFMLRATRERGFVERIKQSFGFYPQDTIDKVTGKNAIWVHAASVGEIVATSPLVREFRKKFPDSPILVSVVTTGGYEMAHRIIKDADAIIYFPLDLPFSNDPAPVDVLHGEDEQGVVVAVEAHGTDAEVMA